MAPATSTRSAARDEGVFVRLILLQCVLAALVIAAQFWFLFPAEEQDSPTGVYEIANLVFVSGFALAVGVAGKGAWKTRAPLLAVGAVFAGISIYEWASWDVESWREDWVALAMWVAASVALVFVSQRRKLPAFVAVLLTTAALARGVALLSDIMDEGALGLTPAEMPLSWTYVIGTALSAAAVQLGVLHLAGRPGAHAEQRFGLSREHGLGAWIAGLFADLRYGTWARANPGKTYGDYYGARLSARLARGGSHKTLGSVAHWERLKTDQARAWATQEFAARGGGHRDWFFWRGVTPDMTCVDYGCGSLRVGQHFIRRLEPGRYFGLDVVDRFWSDGLTLIEPETLQTKRPAFATIGPEGLAQAAALKPDLVYSTAVLQHVPPLELKLYFRNLASIAGDGVVCANFKRMLRTTRIGPNAWAHEAGEIADAVRAAAPDFAFAIEDDGEKAGEDFAKATLVMARDPAALGKWVLNPLRADLL
ncbi:hypothetical protein [Methylopila sp. M107]|uniref:hypothetical protein n=1 Tax=Methylopila sp. M107 TaxID=1101190 RepID=UPI0003A635AA|nr:hypothetical protein [Methylopila sp. M107]